MHIHAYNNNTYTILKGNKWSNSSQSSSAPVCICTIISKYATIQDITYPDSFVIQAILIEDSFIPKLSNTKDNFVLTNYETPYTLPTSSVFRTANSKYNSIVDGILYRYINTSSDITIIAGASYGYAQGEAILVTMVCKTINSSLTFKVGGDSNNRVISINTDGKTKRLCFIINFTEEQSFNIVTRIRGKGYIANVNLYKLTSTETASGKLFGTTFIPNVIDYTSTNSVDLTDVTDICEAYDSVLGKKILWNGTAWVNLDGTALS